MRVLLIYPPSRQELIGYGDLGAIAEPLALEYIAAGARSEGHDVKILDLRFHGQALEEALRAFNPEVVGFTGYTMHVIRILQLCRSVKSFLPKCRIVVGGHHATLMPEDFFVPEVDYVVVGEGVLPFQKILQQLDEHDSIRNIPGIWHKSKTSGEFNSTIPAAELDLDTLPVPARDLVGSDRKFYFVDWMKPIALLRTSVGCPYRCSFCSLWKIMDGHYHYRNAASIAEELRGVDEEFVFLVDDEPFINGRRMLALQQAIRNAGIKKRFFAYCRMDTLLRQRSVISLWRDIGLERLFVGIEAISDEHLVGYNKKLKLSEVEEGLVLAKNLGIQLFSGFVVDTAYRERDFTRLTRFIEHHQIDYPSFTILTPIPGTSALNSFDHITELQTNGRPNWDMFDLQHPVTKTFLPRDEFMDHYTNLYKVFSPKYRPYHDRIQELNAKIRQSG